MNNIFAIPISTTRYAMLYLCEDRAPLESLKSRVREAGYRPVLLRRQIRVLGDCSVVWVLACAWRRCKCGNIIHPQEYRAGWRHCEHCPDPKRAKQGPSNPDPAEQKE